MLKKEEIRKLKREKDAIILAHFYVEPEVQEVADYVSDSFQLSKLAASLPNNVLVFCGVSFMGESAKLLSPEKTVLMPDATAHCPMADMVCREEVEKARQEYEDLAVVCYINSTAEIKSWSDICVTSANAVQIAKDLPNKNILLIPDKNLGHYVQSQVLEKNIITVNGYCPTHEFMQVEEIKTLKHDHPEALVLAHPECNKILLEEVDYIGSTTGIIEYATINDAKEFIIATEVGVLYELERKNPGKKFYFPMTTPVCPDMKKITLEKIINVLKTEENKAQVEKNLAIPAKATLTGMLEMTR